MHSILDRFKVQPDNLSSVTVVSLVHLYHPCCVYYFPVEDFQENVKLWLIPAWINGYTVTIINT